MAITLSSSSLLTSANKIVAINSKSLGSTTRVITEYKRLGAFLDAKTLEVQRVELPNPKDIRGLSKINVSKTFGSAGGLLSGLLGGALDVGGLIRGFFNGKGNKIGKPPKYGGPAAKPRPVLKGNRLRLGGVRALGVTNALFAGLDFASGLAAGESVGKSAAGTAGSLAGSLLGGAIGQTLIPVPGLGFMVGSAVGSFIGGWSADRIYDTAAGGMGRARQKQEQELERGKQQKPNVVGNMNIQKQNRVLNTFSGSVSSFEGFVKGLLEGKILLGNTAEMEPLSSTSTGEQTQINQIQTVEGGKLPSSYPVTGRIGDNRNHKGIDYGIGEDNPISVIKPGKVTVARVEGGYGKVVFVLHDDGVESIYGHLNQINVKEGQIIPAGTVIGLSGSTGRSTGPHVHFELRRGNKAITTVDDKTGDSYFRVGGNVKVSQGEPNIPLSNLVGIEIHAAQPGGKSGLIQSLIDRPNALTQSLVSEFGSYPTGFRDLGGPKRGLHLLEVAALNQEYTNKLLNPKTRQSLISSESQRIFDILKKYPNMNVRLFAGHNDVTKGETGTSGTTTSKIDGKTLEQYFNDKIAQEVEKMAQAAGMTNIKYIRSIIANANTDPNNNWNRYTRMRNSAGTSAPSQVAPQTQVASAPRSTPQNISYTPAYNNTATKIIIVDRPTVTMVPIGGGSGGGTKIVPMPSGGKGGVIVSGGNNVSSFLNKLQEYRLV